MFNSEIDEHFPEIFAHFTVASGRSTPPTSQWQEFLRDGITILSACESNQISLESEKLGHDIFTHFLLQALDMTKEAEEIRFTDLLRITRSAVSKYAQTEFAEQQSPSLEAMITNGSIPLYPARRFEPPGHL